MTTGHCNILADGKSPTPDAIRAMAAAIFRENLDDLREERRKRHRNGTHHDTAKRRAGQCQACR